MAKRSKIEAEEVNLKDLLEPETQFYLPPFQRRYDWDSANVRRILKDIDEILEDGGSKFLGTLVFEDTSSGLRSDPSRFLVVDGQQRITTLYLALTALAVVSSLQKDADLRELGEEIRRQYLLNKSRRHKNTPKILPTFQDVHQFGELLTKLPGDASERAIVPNVSGDDKDTMKRSYDIIRRHFTSIASKNPQRLESILNVLLGDLKFVELILSDEDDPKNVFDSLNDTGIKLSNFDLVRHHVFSKYDTSNEQQLRLAEAAFQNRWPKIEGRLVNNPPKSDPSRYLYPFAIAHLPTTTKSRLFGDLTARWAKMTPDQVLDDLEAYVGPFLSITHSVDTSLALDPGVIASLEQIIRLGAPSSTYSFLMRVVRETADNTLAAARARKCLDIVEAFLVRRAVLAIEPTGLHAVFKDMWKDSKRADPAELLVKLTSNANQPFPTDADFEEGVRTGKLYKRKAVVKHVLYEYERDLMAQAKDKSSLPRVDDDSIEHVMPQTLGPGWPNISTADHDELVHTWGNLVLVSNGFNKSLGNRSWTDKKALLTNEAAFRGARALGSQNSTWDPGAIRKRADELVKFALRRWPRT